MTTAKTIIRPGTVITARPWCDGHPLPTCQWGVVLEPWGCDHQDVLVWFPARGVPNLPGRAVQPILAQEIETSRSLTARPRRWIHDTYRALRDTGVLADTPDALRLAYDTALRHHAC